MIDPQQLILSWGYEKLVQLDVESGYLLLASFTTSLQQPGKSVD
jgi:hypothetical protein